MAPLVSVIIPVYNVADYLEHCVTSVRNQIYKNLEIILVDDGSSDNCPALCDNYAKEDNRIKVIHKENGGLSCARNAGLEVATGDLIAFVDSDDYVHPEYISRLYDMMAKSGAGIAICNFRKIYSNSLVFNYPQIPSSDYITMDYQKALDELVGFNSVQYVLTWNKLYKRQIFDELRFPVGKISEDFYMSFKVLHLAGTIAMSTDQLYYYYLRKGSIIHSRDNVSDYNIEALDEFDEYTEKLGLNYKDKSLFIRCNSVMEDYWAAFKNKNKPRMQETAETFNTLKDRMDKNGVPLNHKAKLFYSHKKLFIWERGLIDIVGSIKIKLNLYR
ncbi:MAG: glycosyltransferase [Saccharofermentans sp.]|nr:glycosyltransferase [Saccharofermentans sp.]